MARVRTGDATKTGVQNATYTYAADAEASDAYAIALDPALTAYAEGQSFTFKANTANTGASSLNVNSLGAKTLKKNHDQDTATGDIEAGSIIDVVYDGTNFQITSVSAVSSGDVVGPASSTDNAIPRFDSTTGKLLQGSSVVIDDSDNMSGGNVGGMTVARIAGSTYSTIQHMQDTFHSTGVISGGGFTDDTDGTITVAAGTGLIRATDSDVAQLLNTDWAAEAGANVALTDNDMNYIYVEYNAGSPQVVATITKRTDDNTNIFLGTVYRSGTTLHITDGTHIQVGNHASKMVERLTETLPFARVSGGVLSETGTRNIAITAGTWWEGLTKFTTPAFDTAVTGSFIYYYSNGAGGFTAVASSTQIDNLQYDNGTGTLATLGNGKYGVHWVYKGHNGDSYVLYGTSNGTITDAQDENAPAAVPPHFDESHAILIGKIIILKSAATFTSIESAFATAFTPAVATDHGGLTGLADDDHTQYSLLSSGAGAPGTTPTRVGEIYVDTTADTAYIATGTASSADWKLHWSSGNDIDLAEEDTVDLDNSMSADEKWTGVAIDGTAGATIAVGDLIYLDVTAGEWLLADASAVGTAGTVPLGLCILASTDGAATKILLNGTMRSAAFPASIALGAPIYASETAGDITATAPTTTDAVVRVLGWAITVEPNTIYFNPSQDHITVV